MALPRVIPDTQECSMCHEPKPASEFPTDQRYVSGLASRCRDCDSKRYAAWNAANPRTPGVRLKYYLANRLEIQERVKTKRRNNLEASLKRERDSHLRSKFGITLERRDEILALQGGGCAGCGVTSSGSRDWHLDHDHATGKLRGVLCSQCNTCLGLAMDSPTRLYALIRYITKHKFEVIAA